MQTKNPTWIYILKGFGICAISLLLKNLVSFAILLCYSGENLMGDLPNYAIHIVCFIASILIYNSVIGIFHSLDRAFADDFIKNKKIFIDKGFIAEAIAIIATLSLAAAIGASPEIAGMFYFAEGKSPHSSGILPMLATLLISAALLLICRYEAVRYWKVLERQGTLDETVTKKKLIIRLVIVCIAYPLAFPFLPLIAFVCVTFFRAAVTVVAAPLLLLTIIVLIAAIIGAKLLLVIRKRKAFLADLSTVVREHGFLLSEIQNSYSSLFNAKKQCSFSVSNKMTTYDCLVIGHLFKSVPICFTSNFEGFFRYRLGTKRHNITMEKHFTFATEGSGVKILVINPTPKYAYICDTETDNEKRLYNADKLWNYVVYEAVAFIGALDRDCLGKYSSVAVRESNS